MREIYAVGATPCAPSLSSSPGDMGLYRSAWQILCLLLVVFGVVVPCLLFLVTGNVDSDENRELEQSLFRAQSTHERKPLDYPAAPDPREVVELRQQIRELEDIRNSVRDELRVSEQLRTKLNSEIESDKESLGRVRKELAAAKNDLQDKRGKLSKVNRDFYDKIDPFTPAPANTAPIIILPAENKMSSISDLARGSRESVDDSKFAKCTFDSCFNLAKCPLTRPFGVYVYNEIDPYVFPVGRHGNLVSQFVAGLKQTDSYTSDPSAACVFVAIMESRASSDEMSRNIQSKIQSLPHWEGDGANHVLIELSTNRDTASVLEGVSTGRAMVSRSFLSPAKPFRFGFDLLLPPLPTTEVGWQDLPPLLPVSRENLIYFHGEYGPSQHTSSSSVSPADLKGLQQALEGRERVDIVLNCPESEVGPGEREGQWLLCGGQNSRLELCSRSMFSLVPSPGGIGNGIGVTVYTRLVESLICGSIPVLIGMETVPFDEVIDWRQAAISLPPGRFSDIHYILRSVSREDIQNLRLHGRNLWHAYFSSPLSVVQSVVAMVRSRTLHPPPVAPEFRGVSLFSHPTSRHKRISSPRFAHNFTTYSRGLWNDPPGPFFTYPTSPFTQGPLSGFQFTELDERGVARLPLHVIDGGGVTGPNFEDLLLGNSPEEQFTVVMLTYQRNRVLVEALARLEEVAFLNKVVVVWNNEEAPPTDLEWPDIGVPIEVNVMYFLDFIFIFCLFIFWVYYYCT